VKRPGKATERLGDGTGVKSAGNLSEGLRKGLRKAHLGGVHSQCHPRGGEKNKRKTVQVHFGKTRGPGHVRKKRGKGPDKRMTGEKPIYRMPGEVGGENLVGNQGQ